MNKKKITICIAVILGIFTGLLFFNKGTNEVTTEENNKIIQQKNNEQNTKTETADKKSPTNQNEETQVKQVTISKDVSLPKEENTKANLFNDLSGSAIPFSAINEISELPENIRNVVSAAAKSTDGVYMLKHRGNKVIMIVDNQSNLRHGIEFVEISVPSGHRTTTTLGYNDKMRDSDNDIWDYDTVSNVQRPLRHSKYNNEGDLEFVETWNYDESNPVKYEMKDASGKVLSMRKETLDDGTHLRVEHLLYDKDGKTKINVSVAYEGSDVKRFTYYNADKPAESGSIFAEYKDGSKVKETVYTSDLKVKNVYEPTYLDGNRTEIKVFDDKNNEIKKLVSE